MWEGASPLSPKAVSVDEGGVQADFRVQHLGHRAPFLGLFAQLIELRLARAGNLGIEDQVYSGDRKTTVDLVQGHFGLGVDAVSLEPGVAENHGKRHGETASVGRT